MSARRPFLSRILMSAVVTAGAFGMLELGLRVVDSDWSSLYDGDPYTHWVLKPDLDLPSVPHVEEGTTFSVRTSAAGIRDGEIPLSGDWVLALGCSTTFGWGVEADEAWPEQLQSLLGVEVINAGIPGHSTHQGLKVASDWIAQRPAVVILGWGLRDGTFAVRPDVERTEPPLLERTRLIGALRSILPSRESSGRFAFRVPPEDFSANLTRAVEQARSVDAAVLLLDMTTGMEHKQALGSVEARVVTPQLGAGHRFSADPIHFTVEGNRAIAEQLAPTVADMLSL